ncbi:MAG: phosphatidylglycerol lysyltransferase domain-containing protein, partial [Solirubrobacteraceae bacterium]
RVVVWGASGTNLEGYRALGLTAVQAGEEAYVDPGSFTLEGRAVRKLRQSVHRSRRRGWTIETVQGRDVDARVEAEIQCVQTRWRDDHPRALGFAMSMGAFGSELAAADLLALARSPEGELRAVMRFARCGALLSLDTMQRIGATPNGLNEALVAAAIAAARELGVAEVSLNYAGLSHLLRPDPSRGRLARVLIAAVVRALRSHFQMGRLMRFNEKFSPQWRPRYLVCESRAALPGAIVRVLQAEGYLRAPRRAGIAPPSAVDRVGSGSLPAGRRPQHPVGERR